jgi:lactoylglutathione lyase
MSTGGMPKTATGFSHVALDVADLDAAASFYALFGFELRRRYRSERPERKEHIFMGLAGEGERLQLTQWLERDAPSPELRPGHFAIDVPDLTGLIAQLDSGGLLPSLGPYRADATGQRVCFYASPDGDSIELLGAITPPETEPTQPGA